LGTEFPPLPAQGTPHRMSGRKVYPNSPREQGGFEYGDVFGPAIDLLLMALQPELARETTIDLFRDVVRDEVIYKPTPASLYGVILEQFVLAIRDRSVPRRCTECARWFDVAPGTNRADRLTCSTTCRSKAYRERQEQARRMHAEGKTFGKIAKELG